MVYKNINLEENYNLNKIKNKLFLRKRIKLFLFFLFALIILIFLLSFQDNISKIIGKYVIIKEDFINDNGEFVTERCAEWGRCTVDYNFKDVNNLKDFNLVGIERRECLDNNKIIVQRRTCDPTISVKIEKKYGQLNILGPARLTGVLPSVKKTDEGVEFFEPTPGLEKEALISRVNLYKEKGIKKLDIEIIV